MIPRFITDHHIHLASRSLAEAKTVCNSTKFYVSHFGVKVAPKQIISLAGFLATGKIWPVSKFSGGEATNRRLRKAGLTVLQFSQPGDVEPLNLSIHSIPKGESTWQSYATS
tara:strand:+ start:1648 stop:1983 length:336 start_codon:yes stop_codon:yes gene_type:complete